MQTGIVERSILHHANKERRRRGLKPLQGHPALIRAARGHSRWMARTRKYSHTGGGGSSPGDRTSRAGYTGRASENLWWTPVQEHSGRSGRRREQGLAWHSRFRWDNDWKLGKAAVITWMNSPGHRENMLSSEWRHIGIGVARNTRGEIYLTQNFGDGFLGISRGCISIPMPLGCLSVPGAVVLSLGITAGVIHLFF